MYKSGYGIWGIDPYGISAFDKANDVAKSNDEALTRMYQNQQLGMQTQWMPQMHDLSVTSDQLKNQKLGLQNTGLGFKNQYYPQDEAVKLSNALTMANRQGLQSFRFGGPMYALNKWLNLQPTPVRTQWIAANPEIYAQISNQQFQNVLDAANSAPAPGGVGQNSDAYNILTPFIKNGVGRNQTAQNKPVVATAYGKQPVQPQAPSPTAQTLTSGTPVTQPTALGGSATTSGGGTTPATTSPAFSSGTTPAVPTNTTKTPNYLTADTVKSSAQNAASKQLDTTSTINRQQAYGRIKIPIEQLIPNIEALAKYQGLLGGGLLGLDAAKARFGVTTDDYEKYLNAQKSIDMIKSDLGPMLGKQATDQAVKDAQQILNFSGNPKLALSQFYTLMNQIQKTGDTNEIPLGQQKAHPELIDKINASPAYGWAAPPQRWMVNGQVYSDGKGNFYSKDEMDKMYKKQGAK